MPEESISLFAEMNNRQQQNNQSMQQQATLGNGLQKFKRCCMLCGKFGSKMVNHFDKTTNSKPESNKPLCLFSAKRKNTLYLFAMQSSTKSTT